MRRSHKPTVRAQERARRADLMALIGSTVADIEAGARLDGEADGIEQSKRAILRFLDGVPEAERDLGYQLYKHLESLRQKKTAEIRARLAQPTTAPAGA